MFGSESKFKLNVSRPFLLSMIRDISTSNLLLHLSYFEGGFIYSTKFLSFSREDRLKQFLYSMFMWSFRVVRFS